MTVAQNAVGTLADIEITYNLYVFKTQFITKLIINDCVRKVAEISLFEA